MLSGKQLIAHDQDLWNKFREGNADAYTALIKKYSNSLYQYGSRFMQDKDFVKDCIQEVFLTLWNRRDHINDTPSVKSYLFKSLRLKIFKEKSKLNLSEILDEDYCFEVQFDVENKLIEDQTGEEVKLRIANALNKLPKRQKEILYLRFYEGLDHAKISQVMGLSKQSAYNLLYESIIHLKETWFQQMVLMFLLAIEFFK